MTADAPTFTHAPSEVIKVAEDHSVTVVCKAVGAPKPVVRWRVPSSIKNSEIIYNFKDESTKSLNIKVGLSMSKKNSFKAFFITGREVKGLEYWVGLCC